MSRIRGGIMASGLEYRAKQAEHMAAPTKMQSENYFLPTPEPPDPSRQI
jgi:hypothetical protein